ncbi:MAG TPA: serine/threonine-protein kinase [Labilithrix sp.]|nr:serine/threonine-protein kinase [Labilithrix sp.]
MTSISHGDGGAVGFLDERYVLGAILGEGAVGCVYAAFDTVLGIDVAVKVMHEIHAKSRGMVERFAQEASISARMLSPHIVKVLGLAVTRSGAPCIVYEHLEGETLASYIARNGALPLAETHEIIKQVARALARVHALGIVHRDVKPDNIFITTQPDGHALVKLLDFGVAESVKPSNARRQVVGTPEYMAPEILFGSAAIDARVDVYALGVVAFECLTGAAPFKGERMMDVFAAVQRGQRASLSQLRTDISLEMDEWMDCALQPDPFWRFESVKELASSLEKATAANITRIASSVRKAA